MSLTLKLASRNLFQDRLRFVATVVGIVFSIVLVNIQMGLFLSFERMVTTMIDHAPADLWIVPLGTKCFEDPSLLDQQDQARILAVPGVAAAVPVVIGFTPWTVPGGGTTPVFIVGSQENAEGLHPWKLAEGSIAALTTDIREQSVQVAAITDGIRSFTTTPYVFTSLDQAHAYTGTPPNKVSYFLVRVSPGTDVAAVRRRLLATLAKVEVLTPAAFSSRSRSFWLFGTGAGAALFAGALLGAIVGTVIVAQTLYSSTKDHLSEFATLRAIGSSNLYIHKVIVWQALLSAVIGFALAAAVSLVIVMFTAETALPILMTPSLTSALFLLTVVMCVISALAAIVQVMRIEPARVFKA
jgi:putative ABC transport system permease protein